MDHPNYRDALRDSLAQAAMIEFLRKSEFKAGTMDCNDMEEIASCSWAMADTMLSEREFELESFGEDDPDDGQPPFPGPSLN